MRSRVWIISGRDIWLVRRGRFTSADWSETPAPVPYADLSDPQTLNLYAYVRNNPLSRSDPTGHCDVQQNDGTTEHHWGSCLFHSLGFYQTHDDQVQDARQYFTANPTAIGGQWIDPDKSTDTQILGAFKTAVDQYRQRLSMGASPSGSIAMASISIDPAQLQAKYKHAEDFGVQGNWNKATGQEFDAAIQSHVNDPGTQTIKGTYGPPGRQLDVIHHVNPQTGLNVMTDPAGNFILGWKLNPTQLQNVPTRESSERENSRPA